MFHKIMPSALAHLAFMVLALFNAGCSAMSGMGQARVADVNGVPCFSVGAADQIAQVLQLQSLYVSEAKSADWRSLPRELWATQAVPRGSFIDWNSNTCLRYGQPIAGMDTRVHAQALQHHRVYTVFIGARAATENVNLLGYKAEFCLVSLNGRTIAREITWDTSANRWRFEACDKQ